MSDAAENKWCWWRNPEDAEGYAHDTREDAISDAVDTILDECDCGDGELESLPPEIIVSECAQVDMAEHIPDVENLIDSMRDNFCCETGADEGPDVKPGGEEALKALLAKWAREYLVKSWWVPVGHEEDVTEEVHRRIEEAAAKG